ncbi:alpha/beta fold hydrolase [Robertkochia aurantiaca]|uniref:alpha/beta fold hydrolase n=1 Tax=Robertkochia aurantiaca TaxID=2873700 RepID=UPI001CCB1036|nr:alpha/beta hydrolase [Robertkochia sp. 3YJGBD-33]
MEEDVIHVYFMPGMAANQKIFEHIELPDPPFKMHFLEWELPGKNESLDEYARRMSKLIKHENSVLVGVSFGGILMQEVSRLVPARKVIVISSVKQQSELPKKMIFARYTKAHKLLPTGLVNNVELLAKYAFGEGLNKRLALYEKYLSVRDKHYLDWSIDKVVNWQGKPCQTPVVHIQGDKDAVFPCSNISDCIQVKGGTHAMIIQKFRWFNKNLPDLILND